MFEKTIFTGFSPNTTGTSARLALRLLLSPKQWQTGTFVRKVEAWLRDYFGCLSATTFDSGRTALLSALEALDVGEGDEVLVQAYTCVVVINAIHFVGATPIYIDVGDDLNMNPYDAAKKITQKTKAMIIQHTFGEPADVDALVAIAKTHGLKIIEDCAHSLGVRYKRKLTGTLGDIGMFSFGSDKVVSCVRGGALITNNRVVADRIRSIQQRLPCTPRRLIVQHLLHPLFFFVGKITYRFFVGKWILGAAKYLHVINRIISQSEKCGKNAPGYPSTLPNALAVMLLPELRILDQIQNHRKTIADVYTDKLNRSIPRQSMRTGIPLRYTLFFPHTDALHREAKKRNIFLGNWYDTPIAPGDIDTTKTDYKSGMCPMAETYALQSINLPTNRHIKEKDALRIARLVNNLWS